jgi:hypothetical protein
MLSEHCQDAFESFDEIIGRIQLLGNFCKT